MDVASYLSRIAFTGPVRADASTLRALQRAHMLTVPFENLDIIPLHRPIRLDPGSLWEKIVIRRRGGFCYELNGLFARLLKEIGFEVTYLNAVSYYPATNSFGMDFDHLALLVRAQGQSTRWLVDVGYGDNVSAPLDVDTRGEHAEGLRSYWVEPFNKGYQLWRRNYDGNIQSQYTFELTDHRFPVEYEAACLYHQTSPESFFTKRRLISRLTEEGRVTLEDRRIIRTRNGAREETLFQEEDFPILLKTHFGMEL